MESSLLEPLRIGIVPSIRMSCFEIKKFITAQALARAVAADWLNLWQQNVAMGKPYSAALSGGRITKLFFEEVVDQSAGKTELFSNVHFFWADERCVPPSDPESNFIVADQLLF